MKSKTSFFNKTIFKKNMTRFLLLPIGYFLLLCGVVALPCLSAINSSYIEFHNNVDIYMVVNAIHSAMTPFFAAFFSILVMLALFGYLYTSRGTNMMHAFPVDRKSLYATNLISAFVMSIVPLFLCALTTTAILAKSHLPNLLALPWLWFACNLLYTFLFLGIASATIMMSGQRITCFVFYWILNFMFAAGEYILHILFCFLCFGYDNAVYYNDFLKPLTPLYFLYEKSNDMLYSVTDYQYRIDTKPFIAMAIYAVVGIGLLFVGYLLYKKKQLESVGDFITLKPLKVIFTVCMSFFTSLLLSLGIVTSYATNLHLNSTTFFVNLLIWCVLFNSVIYFCIHMLSQKTVHVFQAKNWRNCFIFALCVSAFLILTTCDIFGLEEKSAKATDLTYIAVNVNGGDYVFDEPEEIEKILALHKELVANKKLLKDYRYNDSSECIGVSFDFKQKNGKVFNRYYRLCAPSVGNDTYAAFYQHFYDYMTAPDTIKEHYIANNYKDLTITKANICLWKELTNGNSESEDHFTEDSEECEAIYQAILKDIDEGHFAPYFGKPGVALYLSPVTITVESSNSLVLDSMKHQPYFGYRYSLLDFIYSSSMAGLEYTEKINEYDFEFYFTEECVHTKKALEKYGLVEDWEKIETQDSYDFYCE